MINASVFICVSQEKVDSLFDIVYIIIKSV